MTSHDQTIRQQALALADRAEQADGVRPFNESAELVIAGERAGDLLLERIDGVVAGVAVVDRRESSVIVAVDPAHRRRGLGTLLLTAALDAHPGFSVWAFGTLPAATALADALGLESVRGLLKLGRDLGQEPISDIPEGYRVTTYSPADAEAVVAVNAAAFVHHPEQGQLTSDEFLALTRQPWFSPDGLFLARQGDEVAGFHWTKRHDDETGEVYVLAVHPDHGGSGLGRVLLETGLAHLERIGCRRVVLYVEADQERVVNLYRSASFGTDTLDTSFRRKDPVR